MATTDQTEQRKLELVTQLAEARKSVLGAKLLLDDQLSEKKSAFVEFINFPKRVKHSFAERPIKSFAIAIGSGLGASFFLNRKSRKKAQPVQPKNSLFEGLTLAIARPILQKVALQYAQQWLSRRAENKYTDSQRLNER